MVVVLQVGSHRILQGLEAFLGRAVAVACHMGPWMGRQRQEDRQQASAGMVLQLARTREHLAWRQMMVHEPGSIECAVCLEQNLEVEGHILAGL